MHLKHGLSRTPEYQCWLQIKARCLNSGHRAYADYGGRGITIAPEWRDDFEAFYAHVGTRPSDRHSLDRYPDHDGDYAPGNVRWATSFEQNNNRRPHRKHGLKDPPKEKTGKTTNYKHGLIHLSEYKTWSAMKDRCLNPKSSNYPRWGGRGISVHGPWVNDFPAFYAYVGPRPTPQHSLDRYPDNDGNYEPGNVRWATKSEQNLNRRPTITGPEHGNHKHGRHKSSEHMTWADIKTRCFNERSDKYQRYGALGITMCQRWKDSFESFLDDLGEKPTSKHNLLLLDRNGSYSCGKCPECQERGWSLNVRWATRTEVNRARGPSARSGKLDVGKAAVIRARLAAGETVKRVASDFGVGASLVAKIKRFEVWV
jgi:hypothetical protein